MRKFLYVFGAVSLAVVVLLAACIGWLAYRAGGLDEESKAFVDAAVPAIAASWNKRELMNRATPELLQAAKPEQFDALFSALAQFGPLVQYEGAKGNAVVGYMAGSGSSTSANYVASARCKNGTAQFKLTLHKQDGRWLIHNFHVDMPPATSPEKRI